MGAHQQFFGLPSFAMCQVLQFRAQMMQTTIKTILTANAVNTLNTVVPTY